MIAVGLFQIFFFHPYLHYFFLFWIKIHPYFNVFLTEFELNALNDRNRPCMYVAKKKETTLACNNKWPTKFSKKKKKKAHTKDNDNSRK